MVPRTWQNHAAVNDQHQLVHCGSEYWQDTVIVQQDRESFSLTGNVLQSRLLPMPKINTVEFWHQ